MGSITPKAVSKAFTPLQVGNATLNHRIVMAPLTRFRASDTHVPLPMVSEYYAQRASLPGTLIISEATLVSPRAGGYDNVPGIYNDEQIAAWKEVTDAVHKKGSFIYCQLWALGRVAKRDVLRREADREVGGASAVPEKEGATVPIELSEDDILALISDYAQAAKNAITAGFDGVEIHGANGYLIDQFIQDVSNKRTDAWGGSVENRSRLAIEVVKAVSGAVGGNRTAIRLSPFSDFQGMKTTDPVPQFGYLATQLKPYNLAYLHVVEARFSNALLKDIETKDSIKFLCDIWANQSPFFIAGGFNTETAVKAVEKEYMDFDVAVVMGRYFISNPDLPFRMMRNLELTPYERGTFYAVGKKEGFLDYEFSKEWKAEQANL